MHAVKISALPAFDAPTLPLRTAVSVVDRVGGRQRPGMEGG
jgi:hypothetical protein